MADFASLKAGEHQLELPMVEGTEKEIGLDIGKLRSQTGMVTLDPGYVNTGATTSEITFLDGDRGILRYRGYPIEQLASSVNSWKCVIC